ADSGVLFTNAHCAAPACNPSRAALMTGIRPSTSGVYINPQPWRKSPVLKVAKTIPQWFMDHGYSARGSGKIYHGSYPDPASWEEYWPSQKQNKPGDPKPENLPANGIPKTSHFDWAPVPEGDEAMGDWQVATWISERLAEERDKPFFLACGFYRPHLPWFAPQKYFDKFPLESIQLPEVPDDDLKDIPEAGIKMARPTGDHAKVTEHGEWKKAVQAYLANVNFVDACVGRVLDALGGSPHADNTIVVLWSDHGWHLGEKQHWRKFALWDEATRVQMMWNVPGVTEPGGVCKAPVNLLDIYPTLVDLCGLKKNPALEGQSLVPHLKSPAETTNPPTLTTHGRNNHALRSGRYRYIRYADGSEEFYDHQTDPMEFNNLAGEESVVAEMKRMAKFFPTVNVQPSAGDPSKRKNPDKAAKKKSAK
ncbi:MAG: sulfatase, partial [Verrucomicrobiales bacterium]|nr:sulfatase [Verrucomicrobiales bacterium]